MPELIFTPIIPPNLRSILDEELVKWNKRRREYDAKMPARCRIAGEDNNSVTQNIKELFEVIVEIKALLGKVKTDDLPDIKSLFEKELVMGLTETGVDFRILAYVLWFKEVVLNHVLEDVFFKAAGEKDQCKRLVSCLTPPVLKVDAKTAVRWTDKAVAKSVQKLYTTVCDRSWQIQPTAR
ncbi:hypothetical protein PF005_g3098 [Phytophthora fragariae]|uniref:Uncharacterized protein n=2 Tax=Phytophthora fragariae TaxID=53985 RepID=A0A6A4A9J6_9STRA|nr:hypothetical protein PF011_g2498 [Phytophthora fragariae]KAE9231397.1 hypothetical protein PF005_g3098 [Phytophthora fragariae]KAE9253691.1 hypothetical protein PF002_g3217 [Phytophthora fragariae]